MVDARAGLSRRRFLLETTGVIVAAGSTHAAARAGHVRAAEIVVGGPAGMAGVVRDEIIPPFERKHACKVLYEGSQSLINLQKLLAHRGDPAMSVVLLDEDVMLQAAAADVIAPVARRDVPMVTEVIPEAVRQSGAWINYKMPYAAIAYNVKALPGGVASWAELWENKHRRKILLPHLSRTSCFSVLVIAAHLATGKPLREAQYDVDAGFRHLAALKPNLLNIYTNPTLAQNLLEQGEGWTMAGTLNSYVLLRKSHGAPVGMARPREGIFAFPSSVAKVKNGPNPELAHAFINALLEIPAQRLWAERFFDAPAHPAAPRSADIVSPAQLFVPDWAFVARNRKSWLQRFDREIAA